MKFLILIPVLSLLKGYVGQNIELLEDCIEKLELQYCADTSDSNNTLWNLYTVLDNHFTVLSSVPCIGLGYKFYWRIKLFGSEEIVNDFKKYRRRSILFIEANSIPAGEYSLELTISHKNTAKTKSFKCMVRLQTAPIFAAIDGAQIRDAHSGDTVELDGSYSYTGGNIGVKYSWVGYIETKVGKERREKEPELTAQAERATFVLNGDVGQIWKFTLTVTSEKYSSKAELTIKIQPLTTPIIDIMQNCPAAGNYQLLPTLSVSLGAVCRKSCEIIKEFQWNVPSAEVKYSFGPKNAQFTARFHEFDDTIVRFELNAIGSTRQSLATAVLTLPTLKTAETGVCTPHSDFGIELFSVIRVKCEPMSGVFSYKIVQLMKTTDEFFELTLSRNPTPEFAVRFARITEMYPLFRIENAQNVMVNLGPIFVSITDELPSHYNNTMEIALDMYSNKVLPSSFCQNPSRLGNEGRVWEAIQVINALMPKLISEETNNARREFNTKLSTRILQDMLNFPTETVLDSLIIVLPLLMRPYDEPKLRAYALALSDICKHLATKRKDDLKTRMALLYEIIVLPEYRILKDCANYLVSSNYKKLDVKRVTTPPPLEHHPVIAEDYPFYGDIITDTMREDYSKITNNTIEIVEISSFIRILTWPFGEEMLSEETEYFQADSAHMIHKEIVMDRCVINLPRNIGFDDDEKVRIIVNIFNETLLFWENSDITINTVLVNLQILDEYGNETHKLPELVDISFNASQPFNTSYSKANASLPLGETTFNDTNIAVFKIDMRNSSRLQVVFKNVSEPIRVVAIHGKRPLLSDFADSVLISNDSHVKIPQVDYDMWLYIAVLPATAMRSLTLRSSPIGVTFRNGNSSGFKLTRNTEASFDISIISQECVEWRNNKWYKSDCKIRGETSSTLIHCQCYSVSNVAAYSLIPNWKRRDLIVLSITMEYWPTYIPIILTLVVFALYCVAASFAIFRRGCRQQIYYLSDNIPTHNYAYLIEVKTNGRLYSGTTANVVIKVHGQDSQSRAHVLNYPDPDQRLLQSGSEDYFILTTRQHLGELKKIELWTDCLQLRPTWKCDYVKVCDLQKRKWYLFLVENLFSLLGKCRYYIVLEATEISEKRRITLNRIIAAFYWRFGAQHTWNIFSRKDDESFSYMERISIILSIITTAYAIAMLICVFPYFKISDTIITDIDKLEVGKLAIIASIITFAINTHFVFMFRNVFRPEKRREYKCVYRKKIFPEKIKYVIWTLLYLLISFNIMYVLVMGSGISPGGVYVWLAVTTIALLINIFILEILYICILDIVKMTTTSKTVYNYENIVNESQYQKNYLRQVVPGYYSLRPYLVHLYKPLDAERYQRKRAQMAERYKVSKTFKDFIAFIIYFFLLYFLVNSNLDSHRVILNEHITEMIEGQLEGTALEEIHSLGQLVDYLNKTLVLSLHAFRWYGNYIVSDPGLMIDFQTKFLGVARVRQKRVVATSCPARKFCAEVFEITKCIPYYSKTDEDKRRFSEAESLWRYNNRLETGSTYFFGEFKTYYGGGYTTHTGRTLENGFYNIMELSEQKWFDKYTRAVFIEFWTYNANKNLFTIVTVAFEVSPMGYIEKSYKIHSLALIFTNIKGELLTVAIFSVYCLVIFYHFGNIISKINNVGVAFWANAANYFDVGVLLTNFVVIGLYVHKQLVIENILDQLSHSKRNEFTKYFLADYYSDIVTILIAVLMCISVMGTWRFLRFGFTFKVFERAINTQVVPLLSAFTYSLVIYCQYVVISHVLFGSYVRVFRTVFNTITVISLLGMEQFKDYDHDEVENLLPLISMLFFASYRVSLLVVMNVYIAIITLHYEDSKSYISSQEQEFSIMSYLIEEFKYFVACFKRTKYLKCGMDNINTPSIDIEIYNDEPPKVTKKFDDEEQASGMVYLSSNKLELMPLVLFASLYNQMFRYNKRILTDRDYKLMRSIVWYNKHIDEGEQLAYHQMQIDEERSHFVLREDLDEMANIANRLFEPEPVAKPQRVEKHVGVGETVKPESDTFSLKRLTTIANTLEFADRILQNINVKIAHGSRIQSVDSI